MIVLVQVLKSFEKTEKRNNRTQEKNISICKRVLAWKTYKT